LGWLKNDAFPEIKKGGFVVGGAGGHGVVYEKGQHIGYAELTPAARPTAS